MCEEGESKGAAGPHTKCGERAGVESSYEQSELETRDRFSLPALTAQ